MGTYHLTAVYPGFAQYSREVALGDSESRSMKTGEIKEACFECLQFDPDSDTDPENPGHSARLCEAGQNHGF
jgi:hypothetical protein